MAETEAPPVDDAQGTEEVGPVGIHAALARAREIIGSGESIYDQLEGGTDEESAEVIEPGEDPGDTEGDGDDDERAAADGGDDDESAEDDEERLEDDEGSDEFEDDGEDESESEEGEGDGSDEEEAEEAAAIVVSIPGRGEDDEDLDIEVTDQATADRLNQLRNGYMRGEQFRDGLAELQGAQEELYQIEEQFSVDPAGFVMEHINEEDLPEVALGLLLVPGAWEKLEVTIGKLLNSPTELRTLQAETKAARFEQKEKLKTARETRAAQTENATKLKDTIWLMVPEEMDETRRERIIQDMTRDVADHIGRNNLPQMDPKDLLTVLAERLELNGIDPLEARTAVKNGKRTRGKPSTRKKSKVKPKTGKQLAKASAKRKKVAAAPGAGKGAPPVAPKSLPAGQTLKERIAHVREKGLASLLGDR